MCPKPFHGQKIKENFFRREVERTALSESGTFLLARRCLQQQERFALYLRQDRMFMNRVNDYSTSTKVNK